jgi:hypothetical protein
VTGSATTTTSAASKDNVKAKTSKVKPEPKVAISDSDSSNQEKPVQRSKPKRAAHTASTRSTAARPKGNAHAKPPKVKSEVPISAASAGTTSRKDIDSLPDFDKARWVTSFLPTLYARLASALNPWRPYNVRSDLVDTVQEVVDFVYPGSGYEVKLGDKIYTMVSMFHLELWAVY